MEVPSWTAPLPRRHTPLVRRRHVRYGPPAWRLQRSARLMWLWRSARGWWRLPRAQGSPPGARRRGGSQATGGTRGADRLCLPPPRPRARPRGPLVCGAPTGARARPCPGAEREPGARGAGATRRWRYGARAQGTGRGRLGRGRSPRPCVPWWAQREPHGRRAAAVNASGAETVWRRGPVTTARTAWARRKPRASWVCCTQVSQVERALSGTWRLRVRRRGGSTRQYDKHATISRHPTC